MEYITIDDFLKVDIRVGQILSVEEVEGSDKLYRLKVDVGERDGDGNVKTRNVLSGIRKMVKQEDLLNNKFPFVCNLPPRKMMGEYSEAMIMAAGDEIEFSLFKVSPNIKNGEKAR